MDGIARHLWLVPTLPLLAAGVLALVPRRERRWAAGLAIGALTVSLILALLAFARTVTEPGVRLTHNFTWLTFGDARLVLGWVLDPLGAAMLVMVTVVGLLIFLYSLGYMAADENFTRFFCFLSLFAGAMLGVVIANSLLLLFICWELVGLASYLLIGFWYEKPAAAAAAKKAFITTRIGDMALLVGMLWLYAAGGTLVFYDGSEGCLEPGVVNRLAAQTLTGGLTLSTMLGLLIFVGAMGKSGQVPLHVWLPDAMEGPTPVSALIHAATMVAAGVFLVARMFPLLAALPVGAAGGVSVSLQAVTWVGALTAVFAAVIAVAQTDIKRILAYSTVSQLGYMFVGLGVGGVAVGMFHLLTHAFFKALLFLGAGSVIHGCHHEQDIRRMGGLRKLMPVTFATYAVGMMALAGVPVFFAGFWSKDAILHAAHGWPVSQGPYYLVVLGALLTAFYMTRQVCHVFFGQPRNSGDRRETTGATVHESPRVMTVPLVGLAVFAVGLGFLGTPAWPWLQRYLEGLPVAGEWGRMFAGGAGAAMLLSAVVVALGIGLGWWLYGRRVIPRADSPDVLEVSWPKTYALLRRKFLVDELYGATVERAHAGWAALSERLDRWVWGGLVWLVELVAQGLAWASRLVDEYVVNLGFDAACRRLNRDGRTAAGLTDGQLPNYLRALGTAFVCLVLMLLWGGCR